MRSFYLRAFVIIASLLGAVTILGISLLASNSEVWSTTGSFETSQKQLYWSGEMLPDHIAYPVLMAVDRAKIETAEPSDRIYLQLEYGQRRYESAEALLDKNKSDLALTTMTKAQKYWLQAGQGALDNRLEVSDTVRQFTLRTIEFYEAELQKTKQRFGDADRAVIDSNQEELRAVAAKLKTEVATAQ